MNPKLYNPGWRSILLWLIAATALWLVAAAIDRSTEVTIENLGQHLRFAVAGTEIFVPDTIHSVDRVRIHAADSIDKPRVIRLEIDHGGRVEELTIAHRFPSSSITLAPVGDWWVDDRIESRAIVDERLSLDGPFTIRAILRGRFSNEITITLHGTPTVHFSLRRGILDNYLVIRGDDGSLIDVTTLDPTPGADIRAIAAQLMRSIAAACLVIAFVGMLATFLPGEEGSAMKSRAEDPSRLSPRRLAELAPNQALTGGDMHHLSRSEHFRKYSTYLRVLLRFSKVSEHQDLGASHPPLALGLGLAAVVLAGVGGIVSAWVAIDVLGELPHQIDEVVYLLQARWLLDGDVAPAVSAIQEHLRVPFTYLVDGRWIGHYPVGWPAILAVGLAVGAPHLVTPLLGIAFVVLLYLVGREIDDELTGLAAATLAVVSPLARLLCGSMFPHAACAVLVLLALWLLLLSQRQSGWWYGAGAGVALGCCLAVRPMTAVAVSLVLGGWLVLSALSADRPRSTWITAAATTAAGLLASIPALAYNATATGNPLSLPYSLTSGTMYDLNLIPFGIRNLDAILVSTSSSLTGWGWPLITGGIALALPLAFVGIPFLLRRARPEDWLLLALLIVVALGHLPTRANGLHGYGARYVFDVAACLYLLMARGFRELARWARPSAVVVTTVVALFLVLNLSALVVLPKRLGLYRGYYDVTGELERQLVASGVEEALILVEGDDWAPWGEGARLMTGPRRLGITIAADLEDNSVIERAYPNRPILRWNGEHLIPEDRGMN